MTYPHPMDAEDFHAGFASDPSMADDQLWMQRPRSYLPMTARSYATQIMVDLKRAGMDVPLRTKQGFTTQDTVTAIVETAMQKAIETYCETRWWKRLERRLTGTFK